VNLIFRAQSRRCSHELDTLQLNRSQERNRKISQFLTCLYLLLTSSNADQRMLAALNKSAITVGSSLIRFLKKLSTVSHRQVSRTRRHKSPRC
jgi:hypothetical protein